MPRKSVSQAEKTEKKNKYQPHSYDEYPSNAEEGEDNAKSIMEHNVGCS
jgi:hypothetical protein